jgi:hypothetical protein
MASPTPGGNVRVVVRVRKFLPRGRCCLGGMRGGDPRKWRAYSDLLQKSSARQNV